MKKCAGCGCVLQTLNPDQNGFTTKIENDYCQSCFRLQHYGDTSQVDQALLEAKQIENLISNQTQTLYLWVIDLFHLVESNIKNIQQIVSHNPVILVLTKRELYPLTYSQEKILENLADLIDLKAIQVVDILVLSHYSTQGKEALIESVLNAMREFDCQQTYVIGKTNVGKSTLLNQLKESELVLTTSEIPSTTQDLISVQSKIPNLYDTPGLLDDHNLYQWLDIKTVKKLQPKKIKPQTFQLTNESALYLKGYGYFIFNGDKYSVTGYFPDAVECVKVSPARVAQQFEKGNTLLDGDLVKQVVSLSRVKSEIVLHQLGFMVVHQPQVHITAWLNQHIQLTVRKARI